MNELRSRLAKYPPSAYGEEKTSIWYNLYQYFDEYSDPDGYGIFLPFQSHEVPEASDYLQRDKFVVVDNGHMPYEDFEADYEGCALAYKGHLHKVLVKLDVTLSYGHIDFCGELDSGPTMTEAVVRNLIRLSADKACYAFTHTADHRNYDPYQLGRRSRELRAFMGVPIPDGGVNEPVHTLGSVCRWFDHYSRNAQTIPLWVKTYKSTGPPMVTCVVAIDKTKTLNKELFLEQFFNAIKETDK